MGKQPYIRPFVRNALVYRSIHDSTSETEKWCFPKALRSEAEAIDDTFWAFHRYHVDKRVGEIRGRNAVTE